ncbi:uncharacterized protein OGAPODRAFT_16587 [Ogataea polymorpha]|uniref:Uncharacterized protein n=1 Tax=Ogataea polymorpha TaxID=460523 RepID=A0A1B7SH83_9ASCO|nr:uncharacterized protein OGAPODRAFT_16587 [Ogataea polymorpha]KAH3674111.1 hypothetical protein OGATHE_002091 [Ogataea polymorpha]OBA15823.1 hypothetical protein OGAPODRAFT_16587 [Ogataea polymorpha]
MPTSLQSSTQLQFPAHDLSPMIDTVWRAKRSYDDAEYGSVSKKVRPLSSTSSSSEFVQSCQRGVPDVVIKQAHLPKSSVFDLLDVATDNDDMYFLGPESDTKIVFNRHNANLSLPMVLFFFGAAECDFQLLQMMDSAHFPGYVLGVTSNYHGSNSYGFPILLDSRGILAKRLGVTDPLGGGTYPLASVMVFNRSGLELVKILVNYDYNKYFGSGQSLQQVVEETLEYINVH